MLKKELGDNYDLLIDVDNSDDYGDDFDNDDYDDDNDDLEFSKATEEMKTWFEQSPLFKIYGPETEYAYQHPEYPQQLSEEEEELENLLIRPDNNPLYDDDALKKFLNLPHEQTAAQLEHIILYHIGQTYNGISEEYKERYGRFPTIALCVSLLSEVGNESSSLEVILQILRQSTTFYDCHFDDWAEDILVPSIYKLGNRKLDRLMAFLHEPGLYYLFKYQVLNTVTQTAIKHPERRNEVIEWYREVLRYAAEVLPQTQYIDATLAGMIAIEVVDLKSKELLPEIEQMFDTNLVDLGACGDFDSVRRDILDPDYKGYVYEHLYDIRDQLNIVCEMVTNYNVEH